ncbi:MAG: hypothetical protein ACAI35_17445 [Candidatus Methylacidiphilales bacterium]|nr:hypothetical protein [Candidatus Methylacidiphilales bacterium]
MEQQKRAQSLLSNQQPQAKSNAELQAPPPSPSDDVGDLAQLMANYREASRHLWNAHFRPVLTSRNAPLLLRKFKDIRIQLFDTLVLDGMRTMLPILRHYNHLEAYIQITIRPSEACPILIGRMRGKDGYWDHPVDTTDGSDIYLRFLDYFDWDELGPRDMTYYKCEILDFPSQDHLRHHYALLLVDYGVPAINLDVLMQNIM